MTDYNFFYDLQNNSGGFFQDSYAVGTIAETEEEALEKIKTIPFFYLNGCSLGIDCECCGDRWSDYLYECSIDKIFSNVGTFWLPHCDSWLTVVTLSNKIYTFEDKPENIEELYDILFS